MTKSDRMVFLGTSDFAVPSLERLVQEGLPVVQVITRPDRPAQRGKHLSPPPVKVCAEKLGLPVYQPERLEDEEVVGAIRDLAPTVLTLVAYGCKVPASVLRLPRLGPVNLHPSLLPKYRGAAPIQWSLIRGEVETGVTTMYMDEGFDSGDIISQETAEIHRYETYGELSRRLAIQGADLLARTVRDVLAGTAPRSPQNHDEATKARLLKPEDERLRWDLEASRVAGWISGLSPKPGVYTYHAGKRLKLCRAASADPASVTGAGECTPGHVLGIDHESGVLVAVGKGAVWLREVQPENRPIMSAASYANGYGLRPGDVFTSCA